ncbi:uncharacterized protein I303_101311 [Kwoniella dejecticola CBS 10117]|uniref:Major facilitator superfamily (MFS) profile domain-containing protein n=1 Tax=Kwoniella dejecticola CBS 10117 TaxID=1296121 RepID=A0A1A6AHE5_9TREE|nr:uncharacterized protein I303_01319 [Kwoniella dejecticola CBS 10117]OBR89492.1 hypothetical protein I303_01319 [Kwoniella dejecticola CBS 10117]
MSHQLNQHENDVPVDEERKIDHDVSHDVVEPIEVSEEDNKRVLRKIDCVVLPLASLVYFCQYLDKRGLSFAAIFGLQKDLNLKGQDYSWASSIFYFGTLASQFLSIKILHMFSVRAYVGVTVVLWGGVMMAQAAPQNARDLLALRFLLGAYPAFVVLISFWYCKAEHPARFAALYGADIIAQGFGGLFLYGLSSIKSSIQGWRIAMMVAGGLSIIIGLLFTWLVPVNAKGAWFLTEKDRQIAIDRVAREHASAESREWRWDQCWDTLKDVRFYLTFLWAFCLCACTVLQFGTLILNGLGYSTFITTVLQLPSCGLQMVCLGIAVAACRYFPNKRGYVQVCLAFIPFIGAILLQTLPYGENKWPLAGALWLTTCNQGIVVVNLSIISSNIKGHTRKTLFSTFFYIDYATGSICGPQLFLAQEKPLYRTAMRAIVGLYVVYMVTMASFTVLCRLENRRRDSLAAAGDESAVAKPGTALDNKSDVQDLSFRYVL